MLSMASLLISVSLGVVVHGSLLGQRGLDTTSHTAMLEAAVEVVSALSIGGVVTRILSIHHQWGNTALDHQWTALRGLRSSSYHLSTSI